MESTDVNVQFAIDRNILPIEGKLVYYQNEHSFDFEEYLPGQREQRIGTRGLTSFLIGMLQLDVGIDTLWALDIWGYHPQTVWRAGHLPNISWEPGGIRLILDDAYRHELDIGICFTLAQSSEWLTTHDVQTGGLCIGNPNLTDDSECIKFAGDTIAVVNKGNLTSIWLHPEIR